MLLKIFPAEKQTRKGEEESATSTTRPFPLHSVTPPTSTIDPPRSFPPFLSTAFPLRLELSSLPSQHARRSSSSGALAPSSFARTDSSPPPLFFRLVSDRRRQLRAIVSFLFRSPPYRGTEETVLIRIWLSDVAGRVEEGLA